jgi:tetratricopeptide (TPR) repeat protein
MTSRERQRAVIPRIPLGHHRRHCDWRAALMWRTVVSHAVHMASRAAQARVVRMTRMGRGRRDITTITRDGTPQAISSLQACTLTLVVAAVTAFAHWPALSAKALSFDDHQYLVQNPLVQNPGAASAWRFLTEVLHPSTVGGYYQPLTMISLMIDHALGGCVDDLSGFHRTSLALHVINTLLVVQLLYVLFGHLCAAAAVGLLFGVHPLTVETIPWVGERKTLLATFFALLSLIAYVRFARKPTRHRPKWYAVCLILFLFALLSKPTTTPLPLAMLLMDVWPLKRFGRRALLEIIPLLALAAVSAVITYLSQAASYVQAPSEVGLSRIPLLICHNLIFYLRKMAYPADLSSHYPLPSPMSLSHPDVLIGVVGSAALLVALILAASRTVAPLVGWLIFVALIFPTLGVIGFTIVIASDKYVYLPVIGLLMVLAAGLTWQWQTARTRGRVIGGLAIALLVGLEIRGTRQYLDDWQTTERLYARMIRLAPDAATPYFGMGFCHEMRGRSAEAIDAYRRAIERDPAHPHALNNLALLLSEAGQHEESLRLYRTALERSPEAPDLRTNYALTLAHAGRPEEAMEECRRVLESHPRNAAAYINLGLAQSMSNRLDEAVNSFRSATRLEPLRRDARDNAASALWRLGRLEEAIDEYREIVRIIPQAADAWFNLGKALTAIERWAEAAETLRTALRIRPDFGEASSALSYCERQLQLKGVARQSSD